MSNVVDGNQCQTYGISSWLPFQGTGCYFYDPYSFRSFYMASFGMGGLSPENTPGQQQAYAECKAVAPIMLGGDYYPLTPYSLTNMVWMAWQFDRPEQGDGVVQAFRRGQNDEATQTFHLRGLEPSAFYEVTNFDLQTVTKASGHELMERGLAIEIADKPGAALLTYQIAKLSDSPAAMTSVPCDDPNFGLSPYVWKMTGSTGDARAEATFPGAYFKTMVKGTSTLGVVIDGTANDGCPTPSMPVVEYSIDDGPFTVVPLTQTGAVYTLPVINKLDAVAAHRFEFYFRAANLGENRWTASTAHLRIAGIAMDSSGSLTAYPMRPKKAIAYGDSITEGVGVDAKFTSWELLAPNDARETWVGLVCSALQCEYGQIGSGGQGLVTAYNVPGCVTAWDHYDAATPRLVDGRLVPEPDYFFCAHGNNDHVDLTSAYSSWLDTVRKACPHTRIFCIVPPAGIHRSEITAAVNARHQSGDAKVYLIDIPWMTPLAPNLGKPSAGSYDGGHPTLYGQAVFGTGIATKVQEILTKEENR
jgi:alpha-galactosidase